LRTTIPIKKPKTNTNGIKYHTSYPPSEDYEISVLVNPCGAKSTHGREDDVALGFDCCKGVFGGGEFFPTRLAKIEIREAYFVINTWARHLIAL
jgi:hypothetical protein